MADARRQHAITAANPACGWLTLEKAAAQLGTTCATVRRLIKLGVLPAQQVLRHAPWCIAPASLKLPHVLSAIATLKKDGRCGLPRGASSESFELPLR